jgi:hypothetical protein
MKTPTIQEQYNLLKEGKGHKGVFMKAVRSLFPEYVNQYTSFDDAVNILKSKSVLNEGIGGLVTTGRKQDWHAIFNDNINALKEEKEAKAEEKKPTKDVVDMETKNYNYEDTKNIDNLYGQEFLKGYYTEMKDPKNEKKTVDELKKIVAKNLAKDNQYYVKDGQFGVKGLGYSVDHPGLGVTKEVKGKYKSSGMEPVKLKESIEPNLEENKIRKFISQMIKEIMNESPNNELKAAKDEAKMSSEEGYVQQVNKPDNGYDVSDLYDDDTTIYSYEIGEEINNREDMFDDDDYSDYFFDIDTPEDEKHSGNYQYDDENPDLRDLGANPKVYETKIRKVISQLIMEELNMKEIEAVGEDAKVKAMTKKIDDEITKRKKKLKALTTLTELEEDAINPKKLKELTNDIKKLEAARKKLGGKKKEVDEAIFVDANTPSGDAAEIDKQAGTKTGTAKKAIDTAKVTGKPQGVEGNK